MVYNLKILKMIIERHILNSRKPILILRCFEKTTNDKYGVTGEHIECVYKEANYNSDLSINYNGEERECLIRTDIYNFEKNLLNEFILK